MNSLEFQTHLQSEQIKNSKYLSIIGAISYPVWHYIFLFFNPDIVDPLISRILCYAFLWTGAGYLIFSKNTGKITLWMMVLVAGSISTHHFFVAYANQISLLYTAGGLIIVPSVIYAMPNFRTSLALGIAFLTIPIFYSIQLAVEPIQWFYGAGLSTISVMTTLLQYNRFRTMKLLGQSVRHQEWMLSNLIEGVVLKNRGGKIFAANPAAEKILGYKEHDLIGQSATSGLFNFVYEDGTPRDGNTCPSLEALRTGVKQLDQPIAILRNDGSVTWISMNAQPIYNVGDATPSAVLVSFFDITERRNSEKILKDQQARLVSSSKLSALGEMAAGVAHEINNPLAIISGRINQIQRHLDKKQDDPEKLNSLIKNIETTVERISKIVQGLRSFARDSHQDPFTPFSFARILEDTLALCKERFTKSNVHIDIDEFDSEVTIDCRPSEISQILLNLLQNSFDAMEDQKGDKRIAIKVSTEGPTIEARLSDTGPGIPPAIAEKIMQPFFTTKPVGKGTGLGLSVSMGIAEAHGGKLRLADGPATTFILTLPKKQTQQGKSAA